MPPEDVCARSVSSLRQTRKMRAYPASVSAEMSSEPGMHVAHSDNNSWHMCSCAQSARYELLPIVGCIGVGNDSLVSKAIGGNSTTGTPGSRRELTWAKPAKFG